MKYSLKGLLLLVTIAAIGAAIFGAYNTPPNSLRIHLLDLKGKPVYGQRVFLDDVCVGRTPCYIQLSDAENLGYKPRNPLKDWRGPNVRCSIGVHLTELVDAQGRSPVITVAGDSLEDRVITTKMRWGVILAPGDVRSPDKAGDVGMVCLPLAGWRLPRMQIDEVEKIGDDRFVISWSLSPAEEIDIDELLRCLNASLVTQHFRGYRTMEKLGLTQSETKDGRSHYQLTVYQPGVDPNDLLFLSESRLRIQLKSAPQIQIGAAMEK